MTEASYEVAGDDLVVTRGTEVRRLSLAQPWDRFDRWLELRNVDWYDLHSQIRDTMPDSARDQIIALQAVDAVLAVDLVRRWSAALNERLGKCLLLSPSGGSTEPPSPPTSGGDGASDSTGAPTGVPKTSNRTRKPSSAT